MTIDFTKPIQNFQTEEIVNVLYRDERGIYFEYKDSDFVRLHCSIEDFNKNFENVPEPKRQIKGFIGIFTNKEQMYRFTQGFQTKEALLEYNPDLKIHTVIEINATEGDGL